MVSSGTLVMAKDSLLCLSSPPCSAQGLWYALETPALLAKKDADAGASPSSSHVCGLLCPSAPNALSTAI